jgi:hypothetical protein
VEITSGRGLTADDHPAEHVTAQMDAVLELLGE